jgi:glutamate synthase (NADPH/NADH) large chain
MRGIPAGMDLRSPSRHPDILGGDDLVMKVKEFKEAVGGRLPVSLKLGGGRTRDDVKIAFKDGLDFIELDGLQGGTGAAGDEVAEFVGIPTMAALMEAVDGLEEIDAGGSCPSCSWAASKTASMRPRPSRWGRPPSGWARPCWLPAAAPAAWTAAPAIARSAWPPRMLRIPLQCDPRKVALKMHAYLESFRWQMAAITHGPGAIGYPAVVAGRPGGPHAGSGRNDPPAIPPDYREQLTAGWPLHGTPVKGKETGSANFTRRRSSRHS